ncbi:MAG TPA: acyl-CoA synthetase FdrA [Burkholderiales bacterium]|nr:acyl-CoA synthetase FdrA [Burkholderiales bacterium]
MPHATRVVRNLYRDSVALMQLADGLSKLAGVERAAVLMASEANVALMRDAGLVAGAVDAGPNDLLIAVRAKTGAALAAALTHAERVLKEEPRSGTGGGAAELAPRSIEMATVAAPAANLALISTPGEYAAAEAMKALRLGLHVMLFSDNVAMEDEVALKTFARGEGLLVMGPDCGTAIVNGVPLAFANVVRRGAIGLVGASGTGLQQISSLVDHLGLGVSHAIGTGSHDLHEAVGGITMLQGIAALGADAGTRVLVLVSKPPALRVSELVLAAASRVGRPVVVCFLGADPKTIRGRNLHAVHTLEDAARAAVALARGRKPSARGPAAPSAPRIGLGARQRYVRGLYSGGTFCYEAGLLLGEASGHVWSNAPVGAAARIDDVWRSREHTVIDLGDDVFTRGRPHPMIDHRLRNERIVSEAADPEVAVILFDVVLGYGAHPDPAGAMAPALAAARARAARGKRRIALIGFVCGTAADPQNLSRQEATLREAGVLLAPSNAAAVRLATRIAAPQGTRSAR